MEMLIESTPDFAPGGDGSHPVWERTAWVTLTQVGGAESPYSTRAKVLYSPTGVYFLFDCTDRVLSCTLREDFANLFTEDVIEVFLWPHTDQTVYFEYEISPLGFELPIMVNNYKGTFMGWLPWHYEGGRRTRLATSVRGGDKAPGAAVQGWCAEFFIPFALLKGLGGVPARPGTCWRANLCRIDYDADRPAQWSWSVPTGTNFHDFATFGTFRFA
jgi:hypothetical protein